MNALSRSGGRKLLGALCGLTLALGLTGCDGDVKPTAVLYSDQDPAVVKALVQPFTQSNNIEVKVVSPTAEEAQSLEGLSTRVRRERDSPQADLYWARDPGIIDSLTEDGLLEPISYRLIQPTAELFRPKTGEWVGMSGWVRVLVYNPRKVKPNRVPKSIISLAQPAWKGRGAMADPRRNGSSNLHVAALFLLLQEQDATRLLERMKANGVQFLPDEQAVVEAVASGKADWGVTDSDVAEAAARAKKPVKYLVADQELGVTRAALDNLRQDVPTMGTLILCAPLGRLRNPPHATEARKLLEYLSSSQAALALSELQPSRLPTHTAVLGGKEEARNFDPQTVKTVIKDVTAFRPVRSQLALALSNVLGEEGRAKE